MPGGLGSPDHNRPIGEINVTPLVDVMLVLLVIFILTAPLLAQAIRVNLPRVAADPPEQPQAMRLTLYADGSAELDGVTVDADRLGQRLSEALTARPDLVLTLDADEGVVYRRVAELLAVARGAGVQRLSLSTRAP